MNLGHGKHYKNEFPKFNTPEYRELSAKLWKKFGHMSMAEFAEYFNQTKKSEKMIYQQTNEHTAETIDQIGEEELYREMLAEMIRMIPMHKLKTIFPLDIEDSKTIIGYRFHMRKDI